MNYKKQKYTYLRNIHFNLKCIINLEMSKFF